LKEAIHGSKTAHGIQGYLALKKTPIPSGPPWDPRRRATVGSYGGGGLMSEVPLQPSKGLSWSSAQAVC